MEWATIGCLFLFVAFAPHSIAITQAAWLLGMFFWIARFAFYPRPQLARTPIDYALLGFFILTGISSVFSYEPMISIGKLRAASLFTIVYLFSQNIPSRRIVRWLALTLVISAAIGTLYTFGERIMGRGIKLGFGSEHSPLFDATWTSNRKIIPLPIRSGDTVLEVDGKPVRDPSELANALTASAGSDKASVKIYRAEWIATLEVPRGRLLPGSTPMANLGLITWQTGRDWRATGFYGLYVSYAEALQLIIALAIGIFVSMRTKRSLIGALWLLIIAALGL
ncbi:MAG TPA: PDZ domain-containing protein, partial [Pyrinomonadaceae bacterium]|nr:PDZ domain-containing protein [Pyrinomonadaceae bacterium]